MKHTVPQEEPETATSSPSQPQASPAQASLLSRIRLALLDDFQDERAGYDPYDTSRGRNRDVWSAKRKRA